MPPGCFALDVLPLDILTLTVTPILDISPLDVTPLNFSCGRVGGGGGAPKFQLRASWGGGGGTGACIFLRTAISCYRPLADDYFNKNFNMEKSLIFLYANLILVT